MDSLATKSKPIIAAAFVAGLLALFSSAADAADCNAVAVHTSIATRAIIDAYAWMNEGNSDLANTSADVAEHELDVADLNGAAGCGDTATRTIARSKINRLRAEESDDRAIIRDLEASQRKLMATARGAVVTNELANDMKRIHSDLLHASRDSVADMKRTEAEFAATIKQAKKDQARRDALAAEWAKPAVPNACQRPNVAASTVQAVEPQLVKGVSGLVQVNVTIDVTGKPTKAVVMSSPSPLLNDAAIRAALASTFSPEVRDCKPVLTDYIFSVDFLSE